jgi:hypothetical protein
MTGNTGLAAVLACGMAASAAASITLLPAFARPAEEAVQDDPDWRGAGQAAAGEPSRTAMAASSYGESSANLANCPYYPSPVFCRSHDVPVTAGRAPASRTAMQTPLAEARVSLAAAHGTALAVNSGEIASDELEQERGDSILRYCFDMRTGPVTHEVGVDAITGRVLKNSPERAVNE